MEKVIVAIQASTADMVRVPVRPDLDITTYVDKIQQDASFRLYIHLHVLTTVDKYAPEHPKSG